MDMENPLRIYVAPSSTPNLNVIRMNMMSFPDRDYGRPFASFDLYSIVLLDIDNQW